MVMLLLLPWRRSLHMLALRRLLITSVRIRWTGLLLLPLILWLLGHALITRCRSI